MSTRSRTRAARRRPRHARPRDLAHEPSSPRSDSARTHLGAPTRRGRGRRPACRSCAARMMHDARSARGVSSPCIDAVRRVRAERGRRKRTTRSSRRERLFRREYLFRRGFVLSLLLRRTVVERPSPSHFLGASSSKRPSQTPHGEVLTAQREDLCIFSAVTHRSDGSPRLPFLEDPRAPRRAR